MAVFLHKFNMFCCQIATCQTLKRVPVPELKSSKLLRKLLFNFFYYFFFLSYFTELFVSLHDLSGYEINTFFRLCWLPKISGSI